MSTYNEEEYPHVSTLGDGTYSGRMSGYIFTYKGKYYKCDFGYRGINIPVTIQIKDGKAENIYNYYK